MKKILNKLFAHQKLDHSTAREVLINLSNGEYNHSQIAAFISVYLMRSITVEELSGFRSALLELCIPLDTEGRETVDLCGTGGDGKNTFNISTLASFVVAGAGYAVSKHGNYGVSSVSGSSNVLQHFGYKFTNERDILLKQLDEANICFLHAPLFHPALKGVGPIRKELGVKTFFNMLGPLVNPATPKNQLVGVFSLKLAKLYQYMHEDLDKNYTIVHSIDGYDEVSLTSDAKLIANDGERLAQPQFFGMNQIKQEEIFGGDDVPSAAAIFHKILKGEGTDAQNNVVIANAALAIRCFDLSKTIDPCLAEARESLASGKALQSFEKFINLS